MYLRGLIEMIFKGVNQDAKKYPLGLGKDVSVALCHVQCDDAEVGRLVKALLAVRKQKILLQPLCSAALAQLISKVSSG